MQGLIVHKNGDLYGECFSIFIEHQQSQYIFFYKGKIVNGIENFVWFKIKLKEKDNIVLLT